VDDAIYWSQQELRGGLIVSVFGKSDGHFRAQITVYACGPDTRSSPAFNGIRWGLAYADDVEKLGTRNAPQSDVWPEFFDEAGNSLGNAIPLIGEFSAVMHIVFDNMVAVHFQRLTKGTKFFCMEGSRKVAEGFVTSLSVN
jgi:hypothetical protein